MALQIIKKKYQLLQQDIMSMRTEGIKRKKERRYSLKDIKK